MICFHRHRLSRYSQSLYMNTARLITALLIALTLSGCSKKAAKAGPSNKVRVGYIGLTCEAPIFAAVEKGFFKEEGLRSEEHTSELQSRGHLVWRLLLEKK